MILEIGAVALGMLISFFLKDINFLGVDLTFLNSGLIYPDFLLMFIIYFAMHRGEFSGLWIGFFAGLMEDSGLLRFMTARQEFVPLIGVHALIFALTGFTLGKIQRFFDREHYLPQLVVVFATTLIVRLVTWSVMGFLDEFNHSYSFLGPAIYTTILSPIWFYLLGIFYRFMERESK